jgi:hypothetical protein
VTTVSHFSPLPANREGLTDVVSSPFRGDSHVTSVTDAATVTVVNPDDSERAREANVNRPDVYAVAFTHSERELLLRAMRAYAE